MAKKPFKKREFQTGVMILYETDTSIPPSHYDVTTTEKLYAAALWVVKTRYLDPESYLYISVPDEPKAPDIGMTEEQANALDPKSPVAKVVAQLREEYRLKSDYYKESQWRVEQLQLAVKHNDGHLACEMLQILNSDREYRRYEVVPLYNHTDEESIVV